MHTSKSGCRLCSPAKWLPAVWLAVQIAAAILRQQHCTFCVSCGADPHGGECCVLWHDLSLAAAAFMVLEGTSPAKCQARGSSGKGRRLQAVLSCRH